MHFRNFFANLCSEVKLLWFLVFWVLLSLFVLLVFGLLFIFYFLLSPYRIVWPSNKKIAIISQI